MDDKTLNPRSRKTRHASGRRRKLPPALAIPLFFVLTTVLVVPTELLAGKFRNPFRHRTAVEELAEEIDRLEGMIDNYGSVVAKQPDVWGESRLMKHRREFEEQMSKKLCDFSVNINAQVSRSDQAFLTSATSLSAAIDGTAAIVEKPLTANATMVPLEVPKASDPSSLVGGSDATRNPVALSKPIGFGSGGVAIEPTLMLDQMKRYLDHLHEIRRVNEGSDNADAPGYSLNLIRIPVSVLPGEETRQGYGAEVTMTILPTFDPGFLQETFRDLVINDVVDQLCTPLFIALNDDHTILILKKLKQEAGTAAIRKRLEAVQRSGTDECVEIREGEEIAAAIDVLSVEERQKVDSLFRVTRGGTSTRRAKLPLAPTFVEDVFERKLAVLAQVAIDADRHVQPINGREFAFADVERFLRAELEAAYDFLNTPTSPRETSNPNRDPNLWSYCDGLATLIRQKRKFIEDERDFQFLRQRHPDAIRDEHLDLARRRFFCALEEFYPRATGTTTAALSWAIVVESSLLNLELNEDLQRVARECSCPCGTGPGSGPHVFYGPAQTDEARQAFEQYVRCRWPIHVFALDPETQDQNVADSFSQRREMQLALSLALANGQINASHFARYARRIELDMDTIALNRTAVGFSHGADTFGWRFYPRVQSGDIPSHIKTVARDFVIGGPSRDCEMSQWRLEPGSRECVAIVIMPSFVSNAQVDVRSNWFSLKNPKKKQLNLTDAVELSHAIQSMHLHLANCIADAHLYRDGEVSRLQQAVHQLDVRLPLQTAYVQIPYENTLGGFELFDRSVSHLGPELVGFFGSPGVRCKCEGGTTVFLIGDNFGVHDTQVIAGNKDVTRDAQLLSRQVMKITIPANVHTIANENFPRGGVDVRVATPYGVSGHLCIPIVD